MKNLYLKASLVSLLFCQWESCVGGGGAHVRALVHVHTRLLWGPRAVSYDDGA